MDENEDILSRPYAQFLEDFLRELNDLDVECIGVCVLTQDRRALMGFYEATPSDKALMAHHISTDAMFDQLEQNGAWLRDVVADAEDEESPEDSEGGEDDA